jgi:hypothetical protein
VIIFGSVRFLSKKVTKLVKKKKKPNRFKPTSFGSVILEQKLVFPVWLGFFCLARFFWFGSIFFGSARFFFFGLGSIRFFQFQAYKTETKPNRLDFSKF